MEATTQAKMAAVNQQFKRRAIATAIVTAALVGISLVGANRYGLSMEVKVGVPAFESLSGAALIAYFAHSKNKSSQTRSV